MVPLRKECKLVFHDGSFKNKVLKYGTPKPSFVAATTKLVVRLIFTSPFSCNYLLGLRFRFRVLRFSVD